MRKAYKPTSVRDAWFWERYRFRPSQARECPRPVAGKQCTRFDTRIVEPCLCERLSQGGLMDHVWMWLKPTGARVLTTEPYGFDYKIAEFEAMQDILAEFGLVASVQPDSEWLPGRTTLIVISQQVEAPVEEPHAIQS